MNELLQKVCNDNPILSPNIFIFYNTQVWHQGSKVISILNPQDTVRDTKFYKREQKGPQYSALEKVTKKHSYENDRTSTHPYLGKEVRSFFFALQHFQ